MSNDPPARTRRRRVLTAEERALWNSVAKATKPLRKPKPLNVTPHVSPDVFGELPAKPLPRKKPVPASPPASKPVPAPVAPLSPLGRRERSRIAKGRTEIDSRLDLHGLTQSEAHGRLLQFLHARQQQGASVVLVITGKGRMGATSERGVLRRQVPQWLSLPEFRVCVSGFEEAHIGHGGEGALYVRLRRVR